MIYGFKEFESFSSVEALFYISLEAVKR